MFKWKEKFSKPLEIIVPGKLERGLKHKFIFSLKIDLFQGFFHIFLEFLILSIFKPFGLQAMFGGLIPDKKKADFRGR